MTDKPVDSTPTLSRREFTRTESFFYTCATR
jgi:hypothetical protein